MTNILPPYLTTHKKWINKLCFATEFSAVGNLVMATMGSQWYVSLRYQERWKQYSTMKFQPSSDNKHHGFWYSSFMFNFNYLWRPLVYFLDCRESIAVSISIQWKKNEDQCFPEFFLFITLLVSVEKNLLNTIFHSFLLTSDSHTYTHFKLVISFSLIIVDRYIYIYIYVFYI